MADLASSLLREFEGYRSTPYWDVNAYRSGYGSDTMTTADGTVMPIRQGMDVSRDDAERDLARRTQQEFMPRARSAVGEGRWANLSPQQQAALISITYNYGSLPGSVASAIASGDMAGATRAIEGLQGQNGGVNRDRRLREAAIFSGREAFGGSNQPNSQPMPGNALASVNAPPAPNALAEIQPYQMPDMAQDPRAFMSRRRYGNALG